MQIRATWKPILPSPRFTRALYSVAWTHSEVSPLALAGTLNEGQNRCSSNVDKTNTTIKIPTRLPSSLAPCG